MKKTANVALIAALLSMFCVQGGASFAKQLFPAIGPVATTALRIGLAAILLYLINRTKFWTFNKQQWFYCALYGIGIALMNLMFYMSIQRIPLGLAVTVEFIGPLFLAFLFSRKWLDVIWAILACVGILLIVPWKSNNIDLLGLGYAFIAGSFWAVYILVGGKVSKVLEGKHAVSTGMLIAAIFLIPFALWDGSVMDITPPIFVKGLVVAILSSALPFSLDMVALSKMPAKTFSILMSLQPAVGALSGLILLHEYLNISQWISVLCVVVASVGTTVFSKKKETLIQ